MTPSEITMIVLACAAFLLFGVLSTVFAVSADHAQGVNGQKVVTCHTLAVGSFVLMCLLGVLIVHLL